MESRRAPALQRDQQELDWPPAGQLPDDLELHSHYDDSKGASGQGVFGPKKIQNWHQGWRRTNKATANRPGYELAQVELHDKPQKECELIFEQALSLRVENVGGVPLAARLSWSEPLCCKVVRVRLPPRMRVGLECIDRRLA